MWCQQDSSEYVFIARAISWPSYNPAWRLWGSIKKSRSGLRIIFAVCIAYISVLKALQGFSSFLGWAILIDYPKFSPLFQLNLEPSMNICAAAFFTVFFIRSRCRNILSIAKKKIHSTKWIWTATATQFKLLAIVSSVAPYLHHTV